MKKRVLFIIICLLPLVILAQTRNRFQKRRANKVSQVAQRIKLPSDEAMVAKATSGDATAQWQVGLCYLNGEKGVKKDYAEALKWFRKSELKGDPIAKYYIGTCYDEGYGVEEHYTTANQYYKSAFADLQSQAGGGEYIIQYYLGHCYRFGRGTEQNPSEAVKWYRLAAGHEPLKKLDELVTSGKEKLGVSVCYDYNQAEHASTEIKMPRKVTNKQLKIWDNIAKAASEEDANKMIRECHKLIRISELDDSLAYKARLLMAKYYMARGDINDVYESFLYFRYYAAYHLDYNATEIRDELWFKYWNMVVKLIENNNLDGIYLCLSNYDKAYIKQVFNMTTKETWAPFYGVEVSGNMMRLYPGCTIAKWCGAYESSKRKQLRSFSTIKEVTQEAYISNSDRLLYFVEWSDGKVSRGNIEMASIILDNSAKMRAEGSATVVRNASNMGEAILGDVVVNAVSGGFSLLADLISTTRETGFAINNGYFFMNNLVLLGDLAWAKETMVNGQTSDYFKKQTLIYLTHILPHLEFYLRDGAHLICSRQEFGDITHEEYLRHYAATCYPLGNKYGHNNKFIANRKNFNNIINDVNSCAYGEIANSFINTYRNIQE